MYGSLFDRLLVITGRGEGAGGAPSGFRDPRGPGVLPAESGRSAEERRRRNDGGCCRLEGRLLH